jgi:hypothetical protein
MQPINKPNNFTANGDIGKMLKVKFVRSQELRGAVEKFPEFLYMDGLVHHQSLLPEQSVSGHFHMQVLQKLCSAVNCPVITQQLYTPDLAARYFWLFVTLKMGAKETRFATVESIASNVTAEIRKFQLKPSASASNSGRIDGARVCVWGGARALL